MKHIVVTTGLYPPEIGGPATYSKLLEERLPKKGFSVTVVPFSHVRHLPKVIRHVAYFFVVARSLRSADSVLIQDTVSTGLPAMLAARCMRVRSILRVPGDYAWEQSKSSDSIDDFQKRRYGIRVEMLRLMQRLVVSGVDTVIAPSEYLASIVRGWVSTKEVRVVYNGVELPDVHEKVEAKHPLIVSVGRLVPWKGFSKLIDIAKRRNWHLTIIGDGPLEKTLKEQAANQVTFLGALPRHEMLRWCNGADVFVLNTSYEGLSHQLIEVMSLGIPIVTTAVGGNPELIRDTVEGLLVNAGDSQALEQAIEKVLGDPHLAKQLGSRASSRARDFSIDNTIEALARIL